MKAWIQNVGQLNNQEGKNNKWRSVIVTGCLLGCILYCGIFQREAIVRDMIPTMHYSENETISWEQIQKNIMEWVAPVVVYQDYYCGTYEDIYVGNEIPDYFYQNEDASSTQTQLALETSPPMNQSPEEVMSVETVMPITTPRIRYSREQLGDFQFMIDNCYVVDSTTYVDREEMNVDTLLSMDMTMQQDNSDYQILIYHTHSTSETFADSRPGVLEDTPVGLGDTLTELLEGYGYKVYHDRTVYDQVDGQTDRNYAYTLSGQGIDRILAEHPSIEVVIDLHRDGVNENTHLVTTINGKPTAKIMFFNGVSRTTRNGELEYLANPNRQANLAFSLQMYLTGTANYEDFMRRTYIKGYQYNLNRRPKATLIEVGGQTNTLEEAHNAMIPLAEILHQVLSGESKNLYE